MLHVVVCCSWASTAAAVCVDVFKQQCLLLANTVYSCNPLHALHTPAASILTRLVVLDSLLPLLVPPQKAKPAASDSGGEEESDDGGDSDEEEERPKKARGKAAAAGGGSGKGSQRSASADPKVKKLQGICRAAGIKIPPHVYIKVR